MYYIANATSNNIPEIIGLAQKIWPTTYRDILQKDQIDYMLAKMYDAATLQQQMTSGCQFILLKNDAESVGFAAFQHMGEGLVRLHKIYILQTEQGKGAGKFLINYIEQKIQNIPAHYLQLNVNKYNKAVGFYKKLGFEILREEDLDFGAGYYMNDYVLQKRISKY